MRVNEGGEGGHVVLMHDTVHYAICLVFVCSFTGGTYHEDNVDDDEEALKSGLTELACGKGGVESASMQH